VGSYGRVGASVFVGVDLAEEWKEWPSIHRLVDEGRSASGKLRTKEHHPRFQEEVRTYGQEAIANVGEYLHRGVYGIPIPSATRTAIRTEAARTQVNSNKGYHWRYDHRRETV
jgi:hypothetical protein